MDGGVRRQRGQDPRAHDAGSERGALDYRSGYGGFMPGAETYIVRDNSEKHRFEIDLGDGTFAITEYTLPVGKIMFTHTEVPPKHEGKGIGSLLIRTALRSARERGLQ